MSIHQIVYSSRNLIEGTPEAVEAEIASILAISRVNNQKQGVTGALLFNGTIFAQVLEGPLEHIENTYEHIQCDPRHDEVVLLSNAALEQRAFSDWSMAYADPAVVAASPSLHIDFDDACADKQHAGVRIVDMLRALVVRASE